MDKSIPDSPEAQETLDTTPAADVDLIADAVSAMEDDTPEPEPEETPDDPAPEETPEPEETAPEPDKEPGDPEPKAEAKDDKEGDEKPAEDEVPERTWKAVKRQQKEAREAKTKLREMESRVQTIEKERDHYKEYSQSFKAQAAANPLAFMNSIGVDFQTIANQVLADGIPQQQKKEPEQPQPQDDATVQRLEALEARANERVFKDFKKDVERTVEADSPLIRSLGDKGIALVINKAQEYARAQEHIPETADLLSEVEAEVRSELKDLTSHQAVLEELGLSGKELDTEGQSGKPEEKGRRSAPRALTNSARGAGPATKAPSRPIHELSEEEQIALAVSAL